MYRNAYYNALEGQVFLRTWDEEGNRIDTEVPFRPYLFVEQQGAEDAISVFKTSLCKKQFKHTGDRRKYVESLGNPRVFHNLPADQQFLIDMFKGQNNTEEFSKFPLKVYFLDIETYSPDAFTSADKATDPINLITIYDVITKKFFTWGLKNEFTPTLPNHKYFCCKNEVAMLESFLDFWQKDFPDCICGWNLLIM